MYKKNKLIHKNRELVVGRGKGDRKMDKIGEGG